MKTKKRLLATLLTLAMVFSMLPMGALAEEAVQNPPVEAVGPQTPGAVPTETPTETPTVPTETPAEPPVVQVGPAGNWRTPAAPGWDGAGTTYTPTSIVNGSFEIDTGAPWHSDHGALEIARFDNNNYFTQPARADGDMMAELCGSMEATTIYQDITTVPGEVIHWSLKQRTRDQISTDADQMDVVFGKTADGFNHGQIQKNCTANAPDNHTWVPHSGDYVVPVGQISTRFYFHSTHTTSPGSGNLIDDVQFKTLLSTPKVKVEGDKLKVRIYATFDPMKTMYYSVGASAVEGKKVALAMSKEASTNYYNGEIALSALPGGTEAIAVWAQDYITFAQTVTLPTPTACYVKSDGSDSAPNDGSAAHPYKTIGKAYDMAATGGEIRVLSNLDATAATTFGTANKAVTVTSYDNATTPKTGDGWIVKRGNALTNTHLLNITNGAVTLNHITLDGGATWDHATALKTRLNGGVKADGIFANQLVMVNGAGAKLTLDTDAVLQNNQRTNTKTTTGVDAGDTGSALCVINSGTVTMNDGAKILNNDVTGPIGDGAAVSVWTNGTFNMTGGTISGNTSTRLGTIRVLDTGTGTMTMSGGEITGNAVHGKDIGSGFTATVGGIYAGDNKLTVSKTAKITGNNNLSGASDVPANLTGKFAIGDNLTGVANIGVTGVVGAITTDTAVAGDEAFVHSDDPQMNVVLKANKLELVAKLNVYVSATGDDTSGDGSVAHPYKTIGKAYTTVATGGEIRVLSNLTADASTTFDASKPVTIVSYKANGSAEETTTPWKLTRGTSFKGIMLNIINGAVTLKHITLDGAGDLVTSQMVNVAAGANLTLDAGAALQNNKHTGTSVNGGGLVTAGTVVMNAGSAIKGNETTQFGGGVFVNGSGTFTMNGGTISGNKATVGDASGGGICIKPEGAGTVTINGGTISGNSCGANGSAIHGGDNTSKIILNGGSITGNISRAYALTAHPGGAVYPQNSTVTVNGGLIIKDNTATRIDGPYTNATSNLWLGKIKVATTITIGTLTEHASIGVTLVAAPAANSYTVVSDASAVVGDIAHFTSDDSTLRPYLELGNQIALRVPLADTYVKSTGHDDSGNGTAAFPYSTLAMAYSQVQDTNGTIHVMDDLTVDATTNFNADKTITITSCKTTGAAWAEAGDTHTIKRADGFKLAMLDITAGAVTMKHLVLDGVGGLMDSVDGHATDATPVDATAPLVQVHSNTKTPTLTLSDGAVLQNNNTTTKGCAGIKVGSVSEKNGNLNIQTGAKIQYNQTGGTADDGSSSGSAVYVRGSHTQFAMTGGEISHNSGEAYATVNFCMNKSGTALISGGSITANTCTKGAGTGGILVDDDGLLDITGGSITGNIGPRGGIALWNASNSVLNMGNGSAINITGNETAGHEARNIYLNGTKINLTSHLTAGSTIGVYSTTAPTPGTPVLIATGANAADVAFFTSDKQDGAGIRAAKPGDLENTGIYLDVAEKMNVQITDAAGTAVKALYKTFDEAMAAIAGDNSANALHNDAVGKYTVELLANCSITTALPSVDLTIQSDNAAATKHTLTAPSYVATAGGKTTSIKNIRLVGTSPEGLLHAHGTVSIDGCTLQALSTDTNVLNVAGVTTIENSTITGVILHNNSTHSLTINTSDVVLNGKFALTTADATIKLATDSTAAKHYNVELNTAAADRVIFDGTTNSMGAIVADLAKNISVSLVTPDSEHLWAAAASGNNVVLKEAPKYYVNSSAPDDTAAGTATDPYQTIAGAYAAAVAATAKTIHICVLSDLTSAALNMDSTEIHSLTIESYSGDNIKATTPWTITRKDAADPLLTVTKGAVNLTNITLDGNKSAVDATAALVSVGTGTSLTLNDGATIQNNKNTTNDDLGGGVNVTGTLTMNPGSQITGNTLTGTGSTYGGGVYVVDGATFQMNGGTISNNTVISTGGSGGGIMVAPAATTATVRIGGDALITGNSCGANGAAIHGGGVGSTIAISGDARITGNRINATGYVGAAVYPHNGSLVLSDGVQITGNSNQNGNACNVYLGTGKTITIGGAHMGAGSSVGVYCQTMPAAPGATVDIATSAVEADKAHFFSDKVSEAGIKFDGDKIVLAYDERYIPTPIHPGPEPTRPDPNVTVEPGPGKVTTSPKNPDPGTKVTVTIEPETGWKIDKVIIVTVPGGEPVVVTGTNPVTYIAPNPNTVKITVKYKRIPAEPKITGVSKLLETDKHIAYMKGDDKGNFNPEKGITRAETAQMFYNLLKNKDIGEVANFSDVETAAWYADAVNALAALKIIDGRSADHFAPDDYISRAEFTAIAMRFAESVKGQQSFTDVPTDYWAESYIAAAAQYGWIDGYDDGTFKPFGNIKRCEAAKIVNTMLWRFADTDYVDKAENLKAFPDVAKDSWAFYDIMEAANGHDFKQNKTGLETWAK